MHGERDAHSIDLPLQLDVATEIHVYEEKSVCILSMQWRRVCGMLVHMHIVCALPMFVRVCDCV